ncbi:MAG: response regulator, partial [Candidatus Competibacteraceae bacterium]|nr:response regulator [Candidatus Competibacteraceae bacterium]
MQEKIKVLFVDDERHILTALRALFRSQYEVYTATSGSEALDIIRREHIHIIVSDQRMPKMLGSQLLAQVKTLSPHTMRLLLTGYSDMDAIMKSINEGEV